MFPDDPWTLRAFGLSSQSSMCPHSNVSPPIVYFVLALEWVQTGLIGANATNKFAYNFGNFETFAQFGLAWFSVPVMCGIVSTMVQIFYARRIWVLSRSRILAGIVCVVR